MGKLGATRLSMKEISGAFRILGFPERFHSHGRWKSYTKRSKWWKPTFMGFGAIGEYKLFKPFENSYEPLR